MTEFRAQFDAAITFVNGGALQTQDFRLDISGPEIDSAALATALVGHLGLLMVDHVDITNLQVIAEPHRGSRGAAAARGLPRLVDLSHVITEGMTTYPGLPGPEFLPHLTRDASRSVYPAGTEFTIDRISMVGNTGTYVDSPFHRYPDGTDLAGLPLTSLADLPVVVARFVGSRSRGITAHMLSALQITGRAVLLHTGWDAHFGTPEYGRPAPFLTEDGARFLAENKAALVGIDSVNIDDTVPGGGRPAHSILLAAGIPVLEHVTRLADLPHNGARLHAVPPKVAGFGTFPVRAYAVVTPENT
ncbi:kynurenine formamidase [Nakamurella sp. UYEF19]|uniref:cyclase family protein n=1 Tax=Nakamurella sp. UYEF19 TaxID=1756392 RepID=UPI0033920F71